MCFLLEQLQINTVQSKLSDLEEDIHDWIHSGNIGKLEELVLTGYGDLLLGQAHEADDQDVITFLEVLPQYQVDSIS